MKQTMRLNAERRVLCFLGFQGSAWQQGMHGIIRWMLLFILMTMLPGCGGGDDASPNKVSVNSPSLNQAPVFTSKTDITIPENTLMLPSVTARDADDDPITYRIVAAGDADQFHLDKQTGEFGFKKAPNFNAPTDKNTNNIYLVTVEASDGENTSWQHLVVSVIDTGLTMTVSVGEIKTLTFNWAAVEGVTHYKLYVNSDAVSGFTQVGKNITKTHAQVTVPIHLTDWINSRYMLEGHDQNGSVYRSEPKAITAFMLDSIGYIKASNAEKRDDFGASIALSADGKTLAVGAIWEESAATGINGDQGDNSAARAGMVYVFSRNTGEWLEQAYVKASNTEERNLFGYSIALSADGKTLAVSAILEESAAIGIGGDQSDNSESGSGAVYVFSHDVGKWLQQAYVKASNTEKGDRFGYSIALSADGRTLAVGADAEKSAATGIGGDQSDNSALLAGAVYLY